MIYLRIVRVVTFYFAVVVVIERQVIKVIVTIINSPFKFSFFKEKFTVYIRDDDVPVGEVDEVGLVDAAVVVLVEAVRVEVRPSRRPLVGVVFVLVVVQELYDERRGADVRAAQVIPVPELVSLHRAG